VTMARPEGALGRRCLTGSRRQEVHANSTFATEDLRLTDTLVTASGPLTPHSGHEGHGAGLIWGLPVGDAFSHHGSLGESRALALPCAIYQATDGAPRRHAGRVLRDGLARPTHPARMGSRG